MIYKKITFQQQKSRGFFLPRNLQHLQAL